MSGKTSATGAASRMASGIAVKSANRVSGEATGRSIVKAVSRAISCVDCGAISRPIRWVACGAEMRRMLASALCLILLLCLSACGAGAGQGNQGDPNTPQGTAGAASPGAQGGANGGSGYQGSAAYPVPTGAYPDGLDEQPNLIDHGDSVSISFPEQMFEGVELSKEFIEVNRYIDAFTNSDGSVTVVMSKERQQEFLWAYRDDVDYNIDYFVSELDYLKAITYSEDFRLMDIYVDGATDEEELYYMPYFFSLPFENYQMLLGQRIWMTMRVIDAETDETLLSLVFPDADQQ